MAQQLLTRDTCDGHGNLEEPVTVEATQNRINPLGKLNDLCDSCALFFDLLVPRLPYATQVVRGDYIERLFRSGRDAGGDKRSKGPAQLALPGAAPATQKTSPKAASSRADSGRQAVANRGRRIPGLDQVRCPLDHGGANSPDEYWVKLSHRHSHAERSHNLTGPEIAYELPADGSIELPYKCTEHKVCAENGGYGHKSKQSLATHVFKSNEAGWTPADKDSTETAGEPAAA